MRTIAEIDAELVKIEAAVITKSVDIDCAGWHAEEKAQSLRVLDLLKAHEAALRWVRDERHSELSVNLVRAALEGSMQHNGTPRMAARLGAVLWLLCEKRTFVSYLD